MALVADSGQPGPDGQPCGCIACQDARTQPGDATIILPGSDPYFRYACEICGNKRCPHHSNHNLACTRSNRSGQPGSVYQ